jgi:transposase
MESLTELFCLFDDFCRLFEPEWEKQLIYKGDKKRNRKSCLCLSELMTLSVLFHQLRFREFKMFYLCYACKHLHHEFPTLPSYSRIVELMPRCAIPLTIFFETIKGQCDGISIADATALSVCDNKRIPRHRVFKETAARSKTSMGWFYGFKLHAIINSKGEIIAFKVTTGNVDDRKPIPELSQGLFGQLYADKGYIAQWLSQLLDDQGVELITTLKKNMKPVHRTAFEKAILRRRSLIETVFDQLKNLCQIEHTRHRSAANFVVNLISGIVAYSLAPVKPSLKLIRTALVTL